MEINDVIKQAQRTAMAGMHVSIPGTITAVNGNSVDVQPAIRVKTKKGNESAAQLLGVPVIQPSSGGYSVTFPISVGDPVLVIFSDKCIDAWTKGGSESNESEHRSHHLSDAIAIIGLQSEATSKVRSSGGLEISGKGSKITLGDGGIVTIESTTVKVKASDATIEAGNITLKGSTNISGSANFTGNATITGSASITGTLTVAGRNI